MNLCGAVNHDTPILADDWVPVEAEEGKPVTREDISTMGVGGLLKEIPGRPMPRASVGVEEKSEMAKPAPSAVAAIVLAAGQIDFNMGGNMFAAFNFAQQNVPMVVVAANFVRKAVLIRSSMMGVLIGMIPGVGSETAPFITYGTAKQTSKRPYRFGKGSIEGVIGPEGANNAKEGGSLVPTLAFGVPGSSAMVLLIGGFLAARLGGQRPAIPAVDRVHARETTDARRYADAVQAGDVRGNQARLVRHNRNRCIVAQQPEGVEIPGRGADMSIFTRPATTEPKAERQSFDAWGDRRNAGNWSELRATDGANRQTSAMDHDRGFTGHEMLDDFGLIHMNGRIYDPLLGRFMQADPLVQAPNYGPSWNRYTYVFNNPLGYVDPSGYSSEGLRAMVAIVITIRPHHMAALAMYQP